MTDQHDAGFDALIIDFETRCRQPLPLTGAHKYAADSSLDMLCLGYKLITPFGDMQGVAYDWAELPQDVTHFIQHGSGLVMAWNAEFDRLVWEALAPGSLQIAMNRWYCLAAQARVNALPGSLADCTKALFGKNTKDHRGPALIKALSIPQPDGTFLEDAGLLKEMGEYCERDVEESYHCMMATRMMMPMEHQHWLDTVEVNDNGMRVDLPFAVEAIKYAKQEGDDFASRLVALTEGAVEKHTQIARIKTWLAPRLPEASAPLTRVYKKGEAKESLDKTVRQRLLVADDEHLIHLPSDVRDVIEIVDAANRSSVSKYQRMVERAEPDSRVRGAFVYAGASQTLRFASRGLQLHNFGRDCLTPEQMEEVREDVIHGWEIDDPIKTLARALRPTLIPEPGCVFVVGDWSAIEACALPWLANDNRANDRLDLLADPDGDLYQATADRLGLDTRQIGKVAELALGYGGGKGAFRSMGQLFGVNVTEHEAQKVVDLWRSANPWAVDFWNALELSAKIAVSRPGKVYSAGRVEYCFYPGLIDGTLVCTLPDGSMIQYPKAKLEQQETPYGPRTSLTALKANWKPAADEREWPRVSLWRGLLAENVTQAFCAALLRHAIRELLDNDWPVVAHVHDEIVLEVLEEESQHGAAVLQDIMEENPTWAEGLPLRAKPEIMTRYGK